MEMNEEEVIYCDESGFTGNDLYSPEQPYFVYSSVLLAPSVALEIQEKAIKDYKIQSSELKGKSLLKSQRGQTAIVWILESIISQSSVIAFEKKYALAAKFYEYVFEPVLASRSSLFYSIDFHRFISTVLYLHLLADESLSDKLFMDFQGSLRELDIDHLEFLINTAATSGEMSGFLRQILAFVECHKETIYRELELIKRDRDVGNWVLELSLTSIYNLLATWGEKIDSLDVFCDESKPLVAQAQILDVMINREDRSYLAIGNRTILLTFSLSKPIQTVDSKLYPGIQIADVLASTIAYALKSDNSFSNLCFELCQEIIHPNSVFPDHSYVDLETPQGYLNSFVFHELMERTLTACDLFDGMPEYIQWAQEIYPDWVIFRQNQG